MDATKDYYAILGLAPSAEESVIRAAYRVLAQRYHPDRNHGNEEEAGRKMAELNEARDVLLDPIKRKNYDEQRGVNNDSDSIFDDESANASHEADPLEEDWQVIVKYYPELAEIDTQLRKISSVLAYSYRVVLLEGKEFKQRFSLALIMKERFLMMYFGKNPKILDFAERLIKAGEKQAAKALNKAAKLFGDDIDAELVINQIKKDFGKAPPSESPPQSAPPPPPNTPHSDKKKNADYPVAGPWKRFFARFFDINLEISILWIIFFIYANDQQAVFFISNSFSDSVLYLIFLSLPLALLLDAIIYGAYENTPGKKILGLQVIRETGDKLDFGDYLGRNFRLFYHGLGLGIILPITLLTVRDQLNRFKHGLPASYDQKIKIKVIARPITILNVAGFISFFALSVFIFLFFIVVSNHMITEKLGKHSASSENIGQLRPHELTKAAPNAFNNRVAPSQTHSRVYTNADLPSGRPSCNYKQVMTDDDLRACGIKPSH